MSDETEVKSVLIKEVSVEEQRYILEQKINACIRGMFSVEIDIRAAEIVGNVENKKKFEKSLSDTMKTKAAYEQLLKEVK